MPPSSDGSTFTSIFNQWHRVLRKLEDHGVTDADWGKILSSDKRASQVAAVLRGQQPIPPPDAVLGRLIREGKFTHVSDLIYPTPNPNWDNVGSHSRGRFQLVQAPGPYSETNLTHILRRAENHLGQPPQPATLFELLTYVRSAKTPKPVVAFGSHLMRPNHKPHVAYAHGVRGGRKLITIAADTVFESSFFILCVLA